eukprot:Nk52_evm7s303 gene=Nk52_evmTU7s303
MGPILTKVLFIWTLWVCMGSYSFSQHWHGVARGDSVSYGNTIEELGVFGSFEVRGKGKDRNTHSFVPSLLYGLSGVDPTFGYQVAMWEFRLLGNVLNAQYNSTGSNHMSSSAPPELHLDVEPNILSVKRIPIDSNMLGASGKDPNLDNTEVYMSQLKSKSFEVATLVHVSTMYMYEYGLAFSSIRNTMVAVMGSYSGAASLYSAQSSSENGIPHFSAYGIPAVVKSEWFYHNYVAATQNQCEIARVYAQLVSRYNIKHLAVAVTGTVGNELALRIFKDEMKKRNVQIAMTLGSKSFQSQDIDRINDDLLNEDLKKFKETNLNAIVVFECEGHNDGSTSMFEALKRQGILDNDRFIVLSSVLTGGSFPFIGTDGSRNTQPAVDSFAGMRATPKPGDYIGNIYPSDFRGLIVVEPELQSILRVKVNDNGVNRTFDLTSYAAASYDITKVFIEVFATVIQKILFYNPQFRLKCMSYDAGRKNESSCKLPSQYKEEIIESPFFNASISKFLAAACPLGSQCDNNVSELYANSAILYEAYNSKKFGLLGYLNFDLSLQRQTQGFAILNGQYSPESKSIFMKKIGRTNSSDYALKDLGMNSTVFGGGPEGTNNFVQPKPGELAYLDTRSPLRYAAIGCAGLISLLITALFVFVYYFRGNRVIKCSSPPFLYVMLVGAEFSFVWIFKMYTSVLETYDCILFMWFKGIGFALFFGALFIKTYRVKALFSGQQSLAKYKAYTDRRLGLMLLLLVTICAAYYLIYSLVDPPWLEVHEISLSSKKADRILNIGYRDTSCSISGFYYGSLALNGLILLWGVILAIKVRKLPSEFHEAKYFGWAIYNWIFVRVAFDLYSMLMALGENPYTSSSYFVTEAFASFFTGIPALALIFIPKMTAIYRRGNTDPPAEDSKSKPKSRPERKTKTKESKIIPISENCSHGSSPPLGTNNVIDCHVKGSEINDFGDEDVPTQTQTFSRKESVFSSAFRYLSESFRRTSCHVEQSQHSSVNVMTWNSALPTRKESLVPKLQDRMEWKPFDEKETFDQDTSNDSQISESNVVPAHTDSGSFELSNENSSGSCSNCKVHKKKAQENEEIIQALLEQNREFVQSHEKLKEFAIRKENPHVVCSKCKAKPKTRLKPITIPSSNFSCGLQSPRKLISSSVITIPPSPRRSGTSSSSPSHETAMLKNVRQTSTG